ncbi:PH domain-containing protein [Salinimonas marina]|uniref:PH domain-containing protein n=1 Tax=Salinimonas marina TaxID=2785918 RepID=A0A7S9HDI0_9ALTE|nr:PH domain-containing protein [Salinimonas marina]QPG06230.1 PH domain-containing protein [Salinimonas marina]
MNKHDTLPEAEVELDTGKHWRRLSPIAMLYFVASGFKTLVQNGLYAIPALAIGSQTTSITTASWFIPALGGIALVIVGSAALSYFFYHFRVRNNHVEIRRGMFSRRHINLPFWRIQNVKVERPFYYRFTRFSVVILDTAGSASEEASLVAVSTSYATTLRAQILASRSDYLQHRNKDEAEAEASPSADESPDQDQEQVINTRSVKDLVIHGITNNRVWILLGALVPFFDNLAVGINDYLEQYGLQLEQLAGSGTIAWWQWGCTWLL